MSIVRAEDGKKWIRALVVIISIIIGFIWIRFFEQMGEWFDLEAKVKYFLGVTQVSGVLIGLVTFFYIYKHKKASQYLDEVYSELVKVVWPDSDSVVKVTIGIVIGLAIVSGIFVFVDFSFQKLLELVY